MDGHSIHSTAPVRSRTSQSQSPSHSAASASVSSSVRKRKLASDEHPHNFPFSYSDTTKDGAFTSNDDLESISARGVDSESEDDSEEVVDEDDEEDNDDSMTAFTTARLKSSSNPRNKKMKTENSSMKIEFSSENPNRKEERGGGGGGGGGGHTINTVPPPVNPISGGVMKEDIVKGIFTENLQTSGAYTAREESLKREEEAGRLKFVCFANDGIDQHMIWLIGLKNIFARQLPNMPKEYIVRLVMDRCASRSH